MPHPDHPGPSRPAAGRHRRLRAGSAPRRATSTRPPSTRPTGQAASLPPLPLTVWRCGTTRVDATTGWPAAVVAKIVASFSAQSDLIVLLDDRTDPDRQREDGVLATVEGLGRDVRVLSAIAPAPALLDDPVEAQLVIATLDAHETLEHRRARAWGALLRPGGILAVLTHSGQHRGRLVDPTGAIVGAAQAADLLYLQHIVVLPNDPADTTRPPAHDHRTACDGHGQRSSTRPSCTQHRRIHADLLIFINTSLPAPAGRR